MRADGKNYSAERALPTAAGSNISVLMRSIVWSSWSLSGRIVRFGVRNRQFDIRHVQALKTKHVFRRNPDIKKRFGYRLIDDVLNAKIRVWGVLMLDRIKSDQSCRLC